MRSGEASTGVTAPGLITAALGFTIFYAAFFGIALASGLELAPGDATIQSLPNYRSPRSLWTTFLFSGYPVQGDPQAMYWYPISLVLSPIPGSWNAFVLSAYALASTFTYGFTLRLCGSRLGACCAALTYGASGFLVAHLGHTNMIHAAAWLPLVLWALDELRSRSRLWLGIGSLATASAALAGHPQIFANTMLLAIAYAAYCGLRGPRVSGYGARALTCLVLGCGLAAILLVPMGELARHSVRAEPSWDRFVSGSLRLVQLLGLFFPHTFGGATVGPAGEPVVPYFGRGTFPETVGFVGLLPLFLTGLCIGYRRADPSVRFWSAVAGVCLLLALGRHARIIAPLYLIPGYNRFRIPARHLLEYSFAIAILSAFAIAALSRIDGPSRCRALRNGVRLFVPLLFAVLVGCAFAVASKEAAESRLELGIDLARVGPWRNPFVGLQLLAATGGLAALWVWSRRPSRLSASGVALAVALDLGSFGGFAEWRASPHASAFQPPRELERYRDALAASGQRLATLGIARPGDGVPPNLNRLWRIPNVSGYGPLVLARYAELVGAGPYGLTRLDVVEPNDHALDLLATRYLMVPERLVEDLREPLHDAARWRVLQRLLGTVVFENARALPRAWLVPETLRLPAEEILRAVRGGRLPDGREFDPRGIALVEGEVRIGSGCEPPCGSLEVVGADEELLRVRTNAEHTTFLVLSDVHYSGWIARIDGEPMRIHRVNYCLRGLVVPAGRHEVHLEFQPWSFRIGAALTALSLVVLATIVLPCGRALVRLPRWLTGTRR